MKESGIARGELTKIPSSMVKTPNPADPRAVSGTHNEIRWALKDVGSPISPDLLS